MSRAIATLAGLVVLPGLLALAGFAAQPPSLAPSATAALRLPASTSVKDIDLNKGFEDPLPVHLRGDASGKIVQLANCAEYQRLRERVNGSDNDPDYGVVKVEGARCDALAVLRKAGAATRSALPAGDFLAWRNARQYPGTLWPAFSEEEAAKLAAPGATLQTASGKTALKAVSGQFLELESPSTGVHLTLLGTADVDHDGWQDAVVLVEGYARGGSNTTARLAVLTQHEGDQALREIPVDKMLH